MKGKQRNSKSESRWSWNQTKKRNNLLSDFLLSAKASLLGPGAGAGIGCGAGLGFGVVGGYGFGGSQWNQLRLVLGVGIGCGVGLGIGYGQGFGYGYSLESLESYFSEETSSESKTRPKNKGLIEI